MQGLFLARAKPLMMTIISLVSELNLTMAHVKTRSSSPNQGMLWTAALPDHIPKCVWLKSYYGAHEPGLAHPDVKRG